MSLKDQLRKPAIIAALLIGLANGSIPVVLTGSWAWGLVLWIGITIALLGVAIVSDRMLVPAEATPPPPIPPPPSEERTVETPPPVPLVTDRSGDQAGVVVVFVHGLCSSPNVWSHFHKLIDRDPDLDSFGLRYFGYPTPLFNTRADRRIPNLDTLGPLLSTYFTNDLADFSKVVLVTHSMGGLVAQFFLEWMLAAERGEDLARVNDLIMFACPNAGSELLLTMRKLLTGWHPQEREVRPLNARVNEVHQTVVNKVIHATEVSPHGCPIRIWAYAGAEDNVVELASAHSVLPRKQTGVLPGDHFSIVRPDSQNHSAYVTLKKKLKAVLDDNTASPS